MTRGGERAFVRVRQQIAVHLYFTAFAIHVPYINVSDQFTGVGTCRGTAQRRVPKAREVCAEVVTSPHQMIGGLWDRCELPSGVPQTYFGHFLRHATLW